MSISGWSWLSPVVVFTSVSPASAARDELNRRCTTSNPDPPEVFCPCHTTVTVPDDGSRATRGCCWFPAVVTLTCVSPVVGLPAALNRRAYTPYPLAASWLKPFQATTKFPAASTATSL